MAKAKKVLFALVLSAALLVVAGPPRAAEAPQPVSALTIEDWRWAKLEELGREGRYGALLELAKGKDASLQELVPDNARKLLLLGVAGIRASRVSAFEALRTAKPLSQETNSALSLAGQRLRDADKLIRSGADKSLNTKQAALAIDTIAGYLLIIERINAEQQRFGLESKSWSPEDIATRVHRELTKSLSSGALKELMDDNQDRQKQLEKISGDVANEQEEIAKTKAGLDRLRNAISQAANNVRETIGGKSGDHEAGVAGGAATKSGLREKVDQTAYDLQSKLQTSSFSFCEPPIASVPRPEDGNFAAFRYLCSQQPIISMARQSADALVSFADKRASNGEAKVALVALLRLLLSDTFRDDRTASELQEMLERLEKK